MSDSVTPYELFKPRYSSQKIFIKSHYEYCSPGSFVLPTSRNCVYRLLHVCRAGSDEIPRGFEITENNNDDEEYHRQIVKVNIFSFSKNCTCPPTSLRQRSVARVEEIVQTKLVAYISNSDILSICFVFHPSRILSGEFDCLGMESCHLCQYRESSNTSGGVCLEEISCDSFVSFAQDLSQHKTDYNYEIWSSLTTV